MCKKYPVFISLPLPDIAATERLAGRIAKLLRRGDVLALQGDLGSGKTTFARALLRALGITGEVPSPTFTLVQSYETDAFTIHHFDLYRIKASAELDELGFDEALADGVALLEWPERGQDRLTKDSLTLHFAYDNARTCRIDAPGAWAARLEGLFA